MQIGLLAKATTSFPMNLGSEFEGKNFLVIGAGVTGQALQEFLTRHGYPVEIIDERDSKAKRSIPKEIDRKKTIAIVSPGWRLDHPLIQELRSLDVRLISEIDFAWKVKSVLAPDQKWIALTGTNGKTTTIQMVQSIFRAGGVNGVACGNVGRTVIECVEHGFEVLAIELSSFQLAWSDLPRFEAIAILNIAEDHIDWHGNFEQYAEAKMKLFRLSKLALVNVSDATLAQSFPKLKKGAQEVAAIAFHLDTPSAGELGLVEDILVDRAFAPDSSQAFELAVTSELPSSAPHNLLNALAAGGLARAIGLEASVIAQGLQSFALDHHRLELILDQDGIKWIDDSKATNPHAALSAIFSFDRIIWIAGGLAKGASMTELARATHHRIDAAILIGTDAGLIKNALLQQKPQLKIVETDPGLRGYDLMRHVVTVAKSLASRGNTVLLAPACASMDQFSSYAERGEAFTKAVRELVAS